MKGLFLFPAIIVFAAAVFAQKGVDTQTRKINQESTKTNQTTQTNDPGSGRGFDFGKDKTKVRELLANPYRLAGRRDVLIAAIVDVLKEKKLVIDESASRLSEGIIITQPFIFARGAIISQNELNRYAILPASDAIWRSGRYSLRIDVESIDGIQNNVSVTAKIDGKSENGLISEWTTLQSSGAAEDEILAKLVENVTGKVVDEPLEEPLGR